MFSVPVMKQSGFDHKLFQQGALMDKQPVFGSAFYQFTPSVTCNRRKWSVSGWCKAYNDQAAGGVVDHYTILLDGRVSNTQFTSFAIGPDRTFYFYTINNGTDYGTQWLIDINDLSGHFHWKLDYNSTVADQDRRLDLYINGKLIPNTKFTHTWGAIPQNLEGIQIGNSGVSMHIGYRGDINYYTKHTHHDVHYFDGVNPDISLFGKTYKKNKHIFEPKKPVIPAHKIIGDVNTPDSIGKTYYRSSKETGVAADSDAWNGGSSTRYIFTAQGGDGVQHYDTTNGSWVTCDFGTNTTVRFLRLDQGLLGANYRTDTISIYYSDDNSDWTKLGVFNVDYTTYSTTVETGATTAARYWRVQCGDPDTSTGGPAGGDGYEWELQDVLMYEGVDSTHGAGGWHLGGGIALGYDSSGNGNHWNAAAVKPVGQPTAGYCFINHLDKAPEIAVQSNGERMNRFNMNTTNAGSVRCNLGVSSGVYYWEVDVMSTLNGADALMGIANASSSVQSALGGQINQYSYWANGDLWNNNIQSASYGSSYTVSGSRLGVKLDLDALTITYYINGNQQGIPYNIPAGTWYPAAGFNGTATRDARFLFWSSNWTHAPAGMTAANEVRVENGAVYNPNFAGGLDKNSDTLDASTLTGGTLSNADTTFASMQHAVLSEAVMSTGKHRWDIWNINIPTNQYSSWTGIIRSDQSVGNWASTQTMYHNDLAYPVSYYGGTTPKAIAYKNQITLGRELLITNGANLNFYFDADAGTLHVGQNGGTPILMHENIPANSYKIGISDASNTTMTVAMVMDAGRLALGTPATGFEDYLPVDQNFTISAPSVDSPSDNACTWNPHTTYNQFTNGNLTIDYTGTDNDCIGTMGVSSGKYIYAYRVDTVSNGDLVGWANKASSYPSTNKAVTAGSGVWATTSYSPNSYRENGAQATGQVDNTCQVNDMIVTAIDVDVLRVWYGFYDYNTKTLTWDEGGDPAAGTGWQSDGLTVGETYYPFVELRNASCLGTAFFTGMPFELPTGFKELRTSNKPKVKYQGSDYVFAKVTSGMAPTNDVVTGAGFKPDLVIRTALKQTYGSYWFDSVRGAGNLLISHVTNANSYDPTTLVSFDDDGCTFGNNNGVNDASYTDSFHTLMLKQGPHFQVVRYQGTGSMQNIPIPNEGNLNTVWQMGIIKSDAVKNWAVYHYLVGNQRVLYLNLPNAASSSSNAYWSSTTPTVDQFTVGTDSAMNEADTWYTAFWFRSVEGLCDVGATLGNGNADGPFANTSGPFEFLLRKNINSSQWWPFYSRALSPYNPVNDQLYTNSNTVKDTNITLDNNSNGFKIVSSTGGTINTNGQWYIHLALLGASDGAKSPPINAL